MPSTAPPAFAWDWLARQRVVWQEARRQLIDRPARPRDAAEDGSPRPGDVPDWAPDHPDLALRSRQSPDREVAGRDYRELGTRAEVIAALRADYPHDARVRTVVDTVVCELAFLGRLDVTLHELGVRSAPRGMRWWWSHLTGRPTPEAPSSDADGSETSMIIPTQLRLVDVLAGYGDVKEH